MIFEDGPPPPPPSESEESSTDDFQHPGTLHQDFPLYPTDSEEPTPTHSPGTAGAPRFPRFRSDTEDTIPKDQNPDLKAGVQADEATLAPGVVYYRRNGEKVCTVVRHDLDLFFEWCDNTESRISRTGRTDIQTMNHGVVYSGAISGTWIRWNDGDFWTPHPKSLRIDGLYVTYDVEFANRPLGFELDLPTLRVYNIHSSICQMKEGDQVTRIKRTTDKAGLIRAISTETPPFVVHFTRRPFVLKECWFTYSESDNSKVVLACLIRGQTITWPVGGTQSFVWVNNNQFRMLNRSGKAITATYDCDAHTLSCSDGTFWFNSDYKPQLKYDDNDIFSCIESLVAGKS